MSTRPKGSFRMKAESSCVAWAGAGVMVNGEVPRPQPLSTTCHPERLPAALTPRVTHQVLGHFLILHPGPQVPKGRVNLVLADADFRHL